MGIAELTKVKGSRVIGIDASTKSLAFAVFDNDVPIKCGEIKFEGSTVFERLADAKAKTKVHVDLGVLKGDYVAIESAIMVKNVNVAIDMAYVFGAIIGELMVFNPEVHKIAPITWQSGIGNPNLKAFEKEQIKRDHPGKRPSWYQNTGRDLRKARTLAIAREHFEIADGSDNVGDAVGLALYASKTLTRR